jgi:extradiol dioxygenase family protein
MWDIGEAARGGTKNLDHFCLAMSATEWNELRGRLSAVGIELHRQRSENWGAKGVGTSMNFFDPDGNEIEARFYGNE